MQSLVRNMFSEHSACRVASGSNDTGEAEWAAVEAEWAAVEAAAEGSSAVLEARSSSLRRKGR